MAVFSKNQGGLVKFHRYLLPLFLGCAAPIALAHGDHAPPPQVATCKKECTKDEVVDGAKKFLPTAIEKARLAPTWKDAVLGSAEQKKFKGGTEWVVTFRNDKEADKEKQTLYIFVAMNGALSGVNFDGT